MPALPNTPTPPAKRSVPSPIQRSNEPCSGHLILSLRAKNKCENSPHRRQWFHRTFYCKVLNSEWPYHRGLSPRLQPSTTRRSAHTGRPEPAQCSRGTTEGLLSRC